MSYKNISVLLGDGFRLANKSWQILLISLLLVLLSTSGTIIKGVPGNLISLLSFISFFIHSAFRLSVPLFLLKREADQTVSFKELALVTWKSLKRLFLPLFVLFITAIIFLLLIGFILIVYFRPSPQQIQSSLGSYQILSIFLLIITVFGALFEFTSFYFSLENNGLFKALKNSLVASFKNLPYISLVAASIFIMSLPSLYMPFNLGPVQVVRILINTYLSFLITCITLCYYQKYIKGS